ncbi:hypothetical protein ZWY2020_037842 [Hordeum vulgare]|nr:hypothetical protein ZWY2020_037842 [Hordeum vulgare]
MGSQPAPSRAALEIFAALDPAALASLPASTPLTVRSAALSAPGLLYLGTGGGKLLLFSLGTPSSSSSPDFLRLLPIGATRPVSAILPLPSVARVLVLADGMLLLADPLLARPVRRLGSSAPSPPSPPPPPAPWPSRSARGCLSSTSPCARPTSWRCRRGRSPLGSTGSAPSPAGEDSVFAGTASGTSLFSASGGTGSAQTYSPPGVGRAPRIRPLSVVRR